MQDNNIWETYWSDETNLDYWKSPSPGVLALIEKYPPQQSSQALDLGCGIGRHAITLARAGYRVIALDTSRVAVENLKREAVVQKLIVHTLVGDVQSSIFKPGTFDLVISYNVIYHGRREDMSLVIQNVSTLLRPGGIFFFTCPTLKDGKYGEGEQVAPHTFLSPNSITPRDIHHFCAEDDLETLLKALEIVSVVRDEHWWELHGRRRYHSYWQVTARKPVRK
jgi:tellurite methyltransferase